MTYKKLKEFIVFIPGINQSRIEIPPSDRSIDFYDQFAFESDYCFDSDHNSADISDMVQYNLLLQAGDVVISNTKQVACIIGAANAGKILPMNFTKVEFFNQKLDKQYFLYLFNSYSDIQRQKERKNQGSGPIQKIPLRSLGEIWIPYFPLNQQQLVGSSYVEMMLIKSKLKKFADLTDQMTCTVLEEMIKGAVGDVE